MPVVWLRWISTWLRSDERFFRILPGHPFYLTARAATPLFPHFTTRHLAAGKPYSPAFHLVRPIASSFPSSSRTNR